ncbi:putative ATP-binding cassette transporter [Tahibacter aquaticus]|uniref:Putative ATP-binding cassette transporter n=1 Tax=Tahibacter aquaticus TaxID=520092 RepID=A0A4R6YUG8_9GAMM|nr:cyclic peptide export ABC transporter [Tahibacter aquaticus]TDR42081.1 putative ATP-binding cassette transporter [Tahibacter aquaticus]
MPQTLLSLLARETGDIRRDLLIALLISAAANTGILVIINQASASAAEGVGDLRLLGMFIVAMALYVVGLRFTFGVATRAVESMLAQIRQRLMRGIAHADLLALRRLREGRLLQSISQDTIVISESQGLLVAAAHSALMVAMTGVYVLTVSWPAFLIVVVVIAAGAVLYLARSKELDQLAARSSRLEASFLGKMSDMIKGLPEVKLSTARREALLGELDGVGQELCEVKVRTTSVYNANAIFSQSFFYALLAVIVFVLPALIDSFAPQAPKLLSSVLFIFGPLSTLITAVPSIGRADRAAASLLQLEAEIGRAGTPPPAPGPVPRPLGMTQAIECRGLQFHYPGEAGETFSIGPIDLKLPQGEIVMFVGGNGSGKTTLLKVIAGLYKPSAGQLLFDGKPVPPDGQQRQRETFGAIFSDFHLFPKLYGIEADDAAIAAEFEAMRLTDKLSYSEEGFSTRDLSTGQRKRVAMVVAMLENRSILIFDEWAAEQDPEFRAHFYEELLPRLKAKGKTLLVATHDDRYFDIADMVVKMELGRLVSTQRRGEAKS